MRKFYVTKYVLMSMIQRPRVDNLPAKSDSQNEYDDHSHNYGESGNTWNDEDCTERVLQNVMKQFVKEVNIMRR